MNPEESDRKSSIEFYPSSRGIDYHEETFSVQAHQLISAIGGSMGMFLGTIITCRWLQNLPEQIP